MPSTVLDSGNISVNKTDKISTHMELEFYGFRQPCSCCSPKNNLNEMNNKKASFKY